MLQERRSELAESRSMMHSAIEPRGALSSAPRAGADLRAARERIGWSLPAIASALRIALRHLEALEEGRIGDLPGNAYTLGFVRTYAAALGLDPNEVARRFKAEAATVSRGTRLAFPAPAPARGVPAGAVALLGVVLAVGAYAGWYRLSGEGRLPAETSIQVPMRLASRRSGGPVAGPGGSTSRNADRARCGAAGRRARGSVDLTQFGGGRAGCTASGAIRSIAHPAAGERRRMGPGSR